MIQAFALQSIERLRFRRFSFSLRLCSIVRSKPALLA
jgi:hypothetical protein